ncbi:MAG: transcriptional repressor LexA [Nitrospirales bacterium]
MKPENLVTTRKALGMTQEELAAALGTTRTSIARYECRQRRIPSMLEVALAKLAEPAHVLMAGVVAAGTPIEPVLQSEVVDVPADMIGQGDNFALRVKGDSMRDEGILSGDVIIVHRQETARNGQTVVALLNGDATVKTFYRKDGRIELRPENATMQPIVVTPDDELTIQGIVVGVIRYCKKT